MNLVSSKPFRVKIVLSRKRNTSVTVTLHYCGGGQHDKDGQYVAGGVWAEPQSARTNWHRNQRYYYNLPITRIWEHTDLETQKQKNQAEIILHASRHSKKRTTQFFRVFAWNKATTVSFPYQSIWWTVYDQIFEDEKFQREMWQALPKSTKELLATKVASYK